MDCLTRHAIDLILHLDFRFSFTKENPTTVADPYICCSAYLVLQCGLFSARPAFIPFESMRHTHCVEYGTWRIMDWIWGFCCFSNGRLMRMTGRVILNALHVFCRLRPILGGMQVATVTKAWECSLLYRLIYP